MKAMNVKEVSKMVQDARDAGVKLRETDRELRELYASHVLHRDRVAGLHAPKEEAIANMRRLVDAAADVWVRDHVYALMTSFGGQYTVDSSGEGYQHVDPQLPWRMIFSAQGPGITDFIGLFPEQMKARFETIIRGAAVEAGTPMQERAAAVAAIDKTIRTLEEEHGGLVDAAAAFDPPIVLEYLPGERSRRESIAARERQKTEQAKYRLELEEVHKRRGWPPPVWAD